MQISSGILLYRKINNLEVFLAHPGGPFWKNKDQWGIPKGKVEPGEDLLEAAIREFTEEIGFSPESKIDYLCATKTSRNKIVHAFISEWKYENVPDIKSNLCKIEYPPKSGIIIDIPEIDKARFFSIQKAFKKVLPYQTPILEEFVSLMEFRLT